MTIFGESAGGASVLALLSYALFYVWLLVSLIAVSQLFRGTRSLPWSCRAICSIFSLASTLSIHRRRNPRRWPFGELYKRRGRNSSRFLSTRSRCSSFRRYISHCCCSSCSSRRNCRNWRYRIWHSYKNLLAYHQLGRWHLSRSIQRSSAKRRIASQERIAIDRKHERRGHVFYSRQHTSHKSTYLRSS